MSRQGYHHWSILRAGTTQRRQPAPRRSKNRVASRRRHLFVEQLEVRCLLSGDPLYPTPDANSSSLSVMTSPPPPLFVNEQILAEGSGAALEVSPFPFEQTFFLNSLPGATKTIYLDFNGHDTLGTQWNVDFERPIIVTPTYSSDTILTSFSDTELLLIQHVWERVSEDYRPFGVNVTTQDPGIEALRRTGPDDVAWGQRVVIGGSTQDWYTPITGNAVGGVAYGSFNFDSDTPTFVFAGDSPTGEVFIAEATSHEVGHTLGLGHDGQDRVYLDRSEEEPEYVTVHVEYYAGHGAGPTRWGTIMGNSYGVQLSQWSKGEYFNADNIQDDLAIITTGNGFDYRPDDHGNSFDSATAFELDENDNFIDVEGLIERNDDVDQFSFVVEALGELVNFNLSPFHLGPNLDIIAKIHDASGVELFRSNPIDAIIAGGHSYTGATGDGGWFKVVGGNVVGQPMQEVPLPRGTYTLSVDGTGRPITFIDPVVHPLFETEDPEENPLPPDLSDWGYSDYGSLGYYSVTGTRKAGLLVGVDFDETNGQTPFNWTLYDGGEQSITLTDLKSEPGFDTAYDLTISTSADLLTTFKSNTPINPTDLPDHSLPLTNLDGYLTAADGETLTFVYSDLLPDTAYQVFVFGHADIAVQNEVTVTGGYWNGELAQTYSFTQTVAANGLAVNGVDEPGGLDMSTLGIFVISDSTGMITIEVTNAEGFEAGIAGVAIASTELGSISGQKWNDVNGNGGGVADPGEVGLPDWMIYLDLDNNGELNAEITEDRTITQVAPTVPQQIPDTNTWIKNELTFEESGTILDVNVKLNIAHTYNADVHAWLVAPDNVTKILLVANRGGNSDNFTNTIFDDSAATSITNVTPAMAPFTGSFRPEQALSVFNGMNAAGKWTLELRDDSQLDTGTLLDWSIEVTLAGSTTYLEPFQVTDAEGNYTFDGLQPGVYFVREYIKPQQFAEGWRQSWAPPKVLVTSGGDITGIDFGNWVPAFIPGSVSGQKWHDIDGDGEQDSNDVGLPGWVIYIDANNNEIRDVGTLPAEYAATGLPKQIKDFATVTSSITVENDDDDLDSIIDINVTLDITHSFMADLVVFLTSPTGRTVELFSGVGAQFNNFVNITFDDAAERSIETINQSDWPYANTTWRPESPLSEFFGEESVGVWTLTVRDTTFADEGTLNSWSLEVTKGELFTTTDAEGNYSFDNLPIGQYLIREEMQPGWEQTHGPTTQVDGLGNPYNAVVVAGSATQVDFGNKNLGPDPAGDYNRDTVVDAADYVMFRKLMVSAVPSPPYAGADGNGSGSVDPGDRTIWEQHFGESASGAGSVSAGSMGGPFASSVIDSAVDSAPVAVSAMVDTPVDAASGEVEATAHSNLSFFSFAATSFSQSTASSYEVGRANTASGTVNDAAILALLDSFDDAPRGLGSESLSDADEAGDYFAGSGEFDEELDGVDALFELIGA